MSEAEKNGAQAPTPEQVLQDTPDPAVIKQLMEGNARVQNAAATIGFLTAQMQNIMATLTVNNPRLGLAISNELVLLYTEALRRAIKIDDQTPNAQPQAAAEAPEKATEPTVDGPEETGQAQ